MAGLSGFRQAEAVLYLAPATIAEIVIAFCDPGATLFNALNTGEEVEENVVTSALFRTPTSIQPPRAAHLGFRIEF